jgi:hypothetical protein
MMLLPGTSQKGASKSYSQQYFVARSCIRDNTDYPERRRSLLREQVNRVTVNGTAVAYLYMQVDLFAMQAGFIWPSAVPPSESRPAPQPAPHESTTGLI